MPANRWRFALNGSTGFRSPNVDDMAKVFESAAGATLFVPNPNLKPEYTYNADLGITYFVDNKLKVEATGFYTWFRNAIIADKFNLNGQDSVLYNGKMTAVMANQNKAKAYLYGFNAAMTAKLNEYVSLYSAVTFTYGRYINSVGVEVPLDHIPPVFGKTSLMYQQKRFSSEVYALYNGWKRLQEYSPSGEDNLVYATPQGMPSWYTLNVRVGYKLNSNMSIQLALENIMDQNYRQFASGVSAPGRNFVVTLRGNL
jgi:hemoglobin/transferrin/lactoferrin receptor protein